MPLSLLANESPIGDHRGWCRQLDCGQLCCEGLCRRLLAIVCLLALAVGFARPALAQTGMQSYPENAYFRVLPNYYSGEYKTALDYLLESTRGGMKFGVNRWVDSVCYHTMAGECLYELGQYGSALEHYTTALQLYVANQDWMNTVQFDGSISQAAPSQVHAVPWGAPKRAFRVGSFKDEILVQFGQVDNNAAVRQGGVVRMAQMVPVHVQEIVRCTALALYRRRTIMGPLSQHNPLTNEVVEVLSRKRQQTNHWSSAWIDVQLGMAYAAAGKDAQAKTVLERAIVAGGEFDHPLTSMALLELGRIALDAGEYPKAAQLFDETTYAAVNFGDVAMLEEAFRFGFVTHLVSNQRGMYPPLLLAAEWARREDLVPLQASLLAMAIENACILNDTSAASKLVSDARQVLGMNRDLLSSRIGARVNLAGAMAAYQQGNLSAGDSALKAAIDFQRTGSLAMFHIGLTDLLRKENQLSARVAMDVYTGVLRDPRPVDWMHEPLESLTTMVIPHALSFENWFDVAIERRELERAMEIADLSRRHRFYSSLDLGGRLLNLRTVLSSAPDTVPQQAALDRQELLTRYPQYAQLAQKASVLRNELRAMPLVSADAATAKPHSEKLAELAKISAQQEVLLRQMSVRREPCTLVFPPFKTTKQVRESLTDGKAALIFYCTSRQTHGFLMTSDKFAYWPINAPSDVHKQLTKLLRGMGNWDQNKQIRLGDLEDQAWKQSAHQLLDLLTKNSKADLPYGFTELVIVPDGALWYVPFEALQSAKQEGKLETLISQVKLRYAPTMGLAVPDTRPRATTGNMAVVVGRLFPNSEKEAAEAAFRDLQRAVPDAVALPGKLDAPSSVLGSLFDRLVVLNEIAATDPQNPLRWSPVSVDEKSPLSKLESWISLPWGGPDQVILPAFHTPAENGLKDINAAGQEIFTSVCGLMSCGARTVLISRWRPGGQSSFDLIREFVQELPFTTAADAWQRSVQLASEAALNPTLEPRVIESKGENAPATAAHPFFWAGFLLVDTGAQPLKDDAPPPVDPTAPPAAAPNTAQQ